MSGRVVKRAYKYRFYPSPEQATELRRTFGCVRLVYNRALEARTTAWYGERRRVSYVETSAMLTAWKRTPELDFLSEVSSVPLQQALRHLQGAFANFWDKRAGHPTFKSRKKSRASAEYTRSAFRWRDGQLTLAKMAGPLAVAWSRPLPDGAQPSTATVSVDPAGRWHVSILVETTVETLPPTGRTVGIDAGVTSLATLSTGEKITNPRHERADRARLAKAQRVLARKQKGSANRAKARIKVARIHARIAGRRRDNLHKLSTRLVRENQTVVTDDLTVRNMVRNHSLARAVCDAAWRDLRDMLEYKAAWYGRDWTCTGCGAVPDRDVNAARNIRAEGLSVLACGDGVRPTRR